MLKMLSVGIADRGGEIDRTIGEHDHETIMPNDYTKLALGLLYKTRRLHIDDPTFS